MNKRKLLIVLTVITIIAIPCFVFAATSDTTTAKTVRGFFGIDTSKLTDQQKAVVTEYAQKMTDLRKDFINKMVSNGAMTKEQGDAAITRIDEMQKNGGADGLMFGFGGKGKHSGLGVGQIDTSKLTDQQKSGLLDTYKKMADLQKTQANKLATDGLITKDQATAAVNRIDTMLKNLQENGFSDGLGMFMGGFGHFGVKGTNGTTLTELQKADLTEYANKMAELQKELVSKAVSYGLITKEQGETMTEKIDTMKNFEGRAFPNGMKMPRGRFGKGVNQNSTNQTTTTVPTL